MEKLKELKEIAEKVNKFLKIGTGVDGCIVETIDGHVAFNKNKEVKLWHKDLAIIIKFRKLYKRIQNNCNMKMMEQNGELILTDRWDMTIFATKKEFIDIVL